MHPKTKQALLVAIATIAFTALAHAETIYCVNGKETSAGDATRAAMKDAKLNVIKLQVSKVALNDATMHFKKSDDVKLTSPCSIK